MALESGERRAARREREGERERESHKGEDVYVASLLLLMKNRRFTPRPIRSAIYNYSHRYSHTLTLLPPPLLRISLSSRTWAPEEPRPN